MKGVKNQIRFYSSEIVRVTKSKPGADLSRESLSVIKVPENVAVQVKEDENTVELSSSAVLVSLDKNTGAIAFAKQGESSLISEKVNGQRLAPKCTRCRCFRSQASFST